MYDPTKQMESEVIDDDAAAEQLAVLKWGGVIMAVTGLIFALIALWGA